MKKVLATTIAIAFIILILFLIIGCFGPIHGKKITEETMQEESIEKVEKDPEEDKISTTSDIDDKDNDVNDGVTKTPSEESEVDSSTEKASPENIFALIPIYPNIEEVQDESYDYDNQKYSLFAFTDDAPDAVYNWYKDESESIRWDIWKDEGGSLIANYGDFRLVLTIVLIEDNYHPDTRITMNVR